MLAMLLVAQSSLTGISASAQKVNLGSETTEYIIQVDNEKTFDKVVEKNEENIVVDESVEELENQQIIVLEMTEKEAEQLGKQKDVFVEENITLEASSSEGIPLEEITTSEVTEEAVTAVPETSEEVTTDAETIEAETTEEPTTEIAIEKNAKTKKSKKEKAEKKKEEKDKKRKKEKQEEYTDLRSEQWNLTAIHLPEGKVGKDTIKIGILDSGVSYDTDVDVAERITINEKNEVDNPLFDDATGHGTSLAGIIGSKDDEDRIRGVNPNAEIFSIQVLDHNNQTTLSQVVAGIYQAIDADCDILNMSFGTSVDSEILHQAIRDAYEAGILLVAAAGNNAGQKVEFPAAYDEVMAVGSTDVTGNKMKSTCDGEEIEIFAPGSQILTTGLLGGTIVTEGTSIATAQVSGAASLIWSLDSSKSAGFVRSLLVNTSQNVEESGVSDAGLMDVENALAQYNDLTQIYSENVCEYKQIQKESKEAEEFTNVKLVNGSWNWDQHMVMLNDELKDSYYKISSNNIRLMQTAAKYADTNEKGKAASVLHASDNYVKTLKFLYQCAKYLRSGKSVDNAISLANSDSKADSMTHWSELKAAVKELLGNNILSGSGIAENTAEARFYKVLGFAVHLTGDVFAHRTIVPAYTVSGTNPKTAVMSKNTNSADAKFGTNDFNTTSHTMESDAKLSAWAEKSYDYRNSICKRWKCFQHTVNLGVMEFKDIKNFSTNAVSTGTYEDNINFCKERYADAKLACECLFSDAYDKETFDYFTGIGIYFPTEKNVKLNAFKQYATTVFGESTVNDYATKAEWNRVSTPKKY